MKYAVSNIGLPDRDHLGVLDDVAALGIEGLEVSPSRIWEDWGPSLSGSDVEAYRHAVEAAGMSVIGLHTLLWAKPDLGLFRDAETTDATADFLVHLSALCRDLGGHTLVFGSGGARKRGDLPFGEAVDRTVDFFGAIANRIAEHGTCFAFEPLGHQDSDFINSVRDALIVVEAVNSPALQTHLDAKALMQADEVDLETFKLAQPTMVHFHANEPDLGVLGTSGEVDHAAMGGFLRDIGYDGYVSIEQRQVSDTPLADTMQSAAVLKAAYR